MPLSLGTVAPAKLAARGTPKRSSTATCRRSASLNIASIRPNILTLSDAVSAESSCLCSSIATFTSSMLKSFPAKRFRKCSAEGLGSRAAVSICSRLNAAKLRRIRTASSNCSCS